MYEDLKEFLQEDKQTVAGLILFIFAMPVGETLEAVNGTLTKIDEDTIKLSIDAKSIDNLYREWSDSHVDIHDVFY